MSEENRDAGGQFAEPAYGLASVEREAGYVPYKEPAAEETEPEELTIAEAAAQLASRTPESEIRTYGVVDHLPENVSLTVDQAAKLVADKKEALAKDEAESQADRLRAEVDELRGVKADGEKGEARDATPEAPAEPAREGELDPEIDKALSNPKIQAAISAHVAEVEAARVQHLAGANAAAAVAQSAFMSQFPEFAHIPAENLGAAIQAMQQQDPARAAQIAATIQKTAHIFEQQRALHEQDARAKQDKFQEYAKSEDAKFSQLVKGETKETMNAIPALIREALEEYGVDPAEFGRLGLQSEFLRSAAAQRLLVDAAKYRQITKAPKAVATKHVPPVQRPGVARSPGDRDMSSIQELSARLDRTGSVKDAMALYTAQKARRG